MRYRLTMEWIVTAASSVDAVVAAEAQWPGCGGHIVRVEAWPRSHQASDVDADHEGPVDGADGIVA